MVENCQANFEEMERGSGELGRRSKIDQDVIYVRVPTRKEYIPNSRFSETLP